MLTKMGGAESSNWCDFDGCITSTDACSIVCPLVPHEKNQDALGRFLQEMVAQLTWLSDILPSTRWDNPTSYIHHCLPANITSYAAPPFIVPCLSEDEIRLRNIMVTGLALKLNSLPDSISMS
jgi:hypothetical protein